MKSLCQARFCSPALLRGLLLFLFLFSLSEVTAGCFVERVWYIGAVVARSGRAESAQVGRQSVTVVPCQLCNL